MKRALDIVVSAVLVLCLSPVLLVIAIAVRMVLGKPVLWRQCRPGQYGLPFQLVKFRTMMDLRDSKGNLLPDQDRLTPFGRMMRATSLDEFPQLFNVLKGEMSLVGPRPLLMEYLELYTAEQARRHDVLPGITGWAQINGRNDLDWDDKLALDVWYVDNQTFWLDLRILMRTIWQVARGRGVRRRGFVTTERFRGSAE